MHAHQSSAREIIKNNYSALFQGHFSVGKKIKIGATNPTICRFCNKSIPDISFKNIAHAIPELLGNRQLIVSDECDTCNSFFAENLEDHLGKLTKPFRLTGSVRGKSGIPSYVTPDKKARVDSTPENGFKLDHQHDSTFIKHLEESKQLELNFIIEKHIPCAAYKALVKIALSVMPETDLHDFQDAIRWILCCDHEIPIMKSLIVWASFTQVPLKETSILLLRKNIDSKKFDLPHCLLITNFGNLQLQIIIPTDLEASNTENEVSFSFTVPRLESPFAKKLPLGACQNFEMDLTANLVVRPRTINIKASYTTREKI